MHTNTLGIVAALVGALVLTGFGSAHRACAQGMRAPVRNKSREFRRCVTSWKELQRRNVVMQERDFSCGAAALATVAKYYWGDDVTELEFLRQLDGLLNREEVADRIKNGLTLTDLKRSAEKAGYQASMGELSLTELAESKVPLIVGITVREYDHFVVYRGMDWEYVYLADPIRGNVRIPITEFAGQWQKNAILVIAKKGAKSLPKNSPLRVRANEVYLGEVNMRYIQQNVLRNAVPPAVRRSP